VPSFNVKKKAGIELAVSPKIALHYPKKTKKIKFQRGIELLGTTRK
jgi:hypothetical protein